VSRSGDVNAEDNINNFDFFRASEALTTTWKVEVVPHQLIRETTEIQTTGSGGFGTSSVQRKTFFDKADTIKINATSGRTVVEGKIPLWELPAGKFAPVIVLQTKRGAYQTYRVPYQGDDANKQLRGPELPAWFAGILDLFGVAAGVVSTQGRLEEALKDYVPESTWVPLPAFSATITVDKEEDGNGAELDLGYLDYTYELAMSEEIGQDSPGVGLLAMGPGIIGAETEVKGTLKVSGRDVETSLTIAGTLTTKPTGRRSPRSAAPP